MIIAITALKGGVGKTTTTVNVAAALAKSGARVLVIDLEHPDAAHARARPPGRSPEARLDRE